MTKIRYGMYETNSSSMHSLTIGGTNIIDPLVSTADEKLVLGIGEYGWGYDELTTELEKLDYLAIETETNETKKELLLEAIKLMYPNANIVFKYNGYINHQSYGEIWGSITTVQDVIDIIKGNATIIIDHDNH